MKIIARAISYALLLLCVFGLFHQASAYTSPGKPVGYVNDFANILPIETKSALETELRDFAVSSSTEIVVATVTTLNGDDIATYANELFREWGIGKKGANNGVLLLVAPNERRVRIEVGYGLEGALTDIQSGYIIDNVITPSFKRGDYAGGIVGGVEAIKKVVSGEKFNTTNSNTSPTPTSDTWITLIVFGFFCLQWTAAILARSKSWWAGGTLGAIVGVILGYIYGLLYVGLIAVPVLFLLGLLFDYFVSNQYQKHKESGKSMPWYIGGGSSSGGGFGGFGGGSSGGGGASGGW